MLCVLVHLRAEAIEFYVSAQGSDTNVGTLLEPFGTISRAYSLAGPGVTIVVMPGVYADYTNGYGLRLRASGTASMPIILKSQVKGAAVIDGQNATNRNVAIYLEGSYNIIDGFEIKGGPNGGIKIWGNYNQIINNEIHHNGNVASASLYGQDGIYSDKVTRNNIYAENYIHDNGRNGSNLDHGLYLCGDNELVINNVLLRNAAYGIHIAGYSTVSNIRIYNNVTAFNGKSGIILWQSLNGVEIKNNIFYRNGRYGIDCWDAHGSGAVMDRNLVFGNTLGGYNLTGGGSDVSHMRGTTLVAEPLFADASSARFDSHLKPGSPLINAGLNLSSVFGTDKDGVARPSSGAWDVGAYSEMASPGITVTAPANNATISGASVTLSAEVSDDESENGLMGVQFTLNGASLGVEDTNAPHRLTFNTTLVPDGPHLLSAISRDSAGQKSTAVAVPVIVENSNAPPQISTIANQIIAMDRSTAVIGFSVSDEETPANIVTVSGSSSNPTLLPRNAIIFGGGGSSRTIKLTPQAGQFGNAIVTVSVSDGKTNTSTSFLLKVKPGVAPQFIYLPFEAESTSIVAPMEIALDNAAAEGRYVISSGLHAGTASFEVDIPVSGAYSIWCRVAAPDVSNNSFYVSVDGGAEDIYDAAEGRRTNAWQWTVVNGRGGTNFRAPLAVNPRTFLLSIGLHNIVFRGREPTGLDQILLTNDPEYVPNGVAWLIPPAVRIASINFDPAGFVTLKWPTVPGKTYRVVYKTNLSEGEWTALPPDLTAIGPLTSRSDQVGGDRHYRVITLP